MHLISLRKLGLAMVVAATPVAAHAQDMRDIFHSSYALWGMMDALANHCWEAVDYEVSYMEAHQNWLARNVFVRDELDQALAASGQPSDLATLGEQDGASGIMEIVRAQADQRAVCLNWRDSANAGGYEAETFLSYQLGMLRERDGM